jgi:Spy/CpxP family protein refolding chaperone
MRTTIGISLICGLLAAAAFAMAQRPGGQDAPPRQSEGDDLLPRMMAFDKDGDGKLTRTEVTDARLQRLFDRADINQDGTVTKEELTALAAKEKVTNRGGGPGGFGPPGGGPGGPMMAPMRPGEVLPGMFQQRLRLSAEQKSQVEDLQKEVDARLAKILTSEQNAQLKEMRSRGPGGFGPPGRGRPPGGGGDGPPPTDGPP